MADPIIKIKRSAVPGKIPTTTTLPIGEFAINTHDGKVFIQQNQGGVGVGSTVIVINPWSVGPGTNTYNTYFVSENVGIGTTNPTSKLSVIGDVSITGISTIGTLKISSGILTATSGIITYYGDGSKLTNIVSGVGIATVGGTVGTGVTILDFRGVGISTITVASGIATINVIGGGGASVSIGETAPVTPSDGDLWYNSNYGRLFIYYQDGDSNQWVDAAPFNYTGITTATYTENSFIASAGQTIFNVTYEVGYVDVYLNGIRLNSSEYTATTGTTVVLNEAASLGDVVDVIEVATNRGPTGPQGPAGSTTLSGITTTLSSTVHYPVFVSGVGNNEPFISTTSNYFSFIPSSGTLFIDKLNVGFITASNVYTTGVVTATDFNSSSDINLKNNIEIINNPIEKVLQIKGVLFKWNSNNKSSAGAIAQDVEKIMPEIVSQLDGHKTLNYNGLIGLLIEAVKNQQEQINILTSRIEKLEG